MSLPRLTVMLPEILDAMLALAVRYGHVAGRRNLDVDAVVRRFMRESRK